METGRSPSLPSSLMALRNPFPWAGMKIQILKQPVEERALPTPKQVSPIPAQGSIVMATSRMSAEEQ